MKAIHSGIAVAASPILWIVSASSATLPEKATTIICRPAVIARSDERPLDRPDAAARRGDGRVHDAMRVPVPAFAVGMAVAVAAVASMGMSVLAEAEPVERCPQHGRPSPAPQRYLAISLNSSIGRRLPRGTGPTASSRQWSR